MHQEDTQGGFGPAHGSMHHSASALHMQQSGGSAVQAGFDGSSGQRCVNAQQMSAGQSI